MVYLIIIASDISIQFTQTKFQVNTIKNIGVIWKNVFSHARVMAIGVSSDFNAKCISMLVNASKRPNRETA